MEKPLDLRIIFLFSEYEKCFPISNGNKPITTLDFLLKAIPILEKLKGTNAVDYLTNADYIVNFFSIDTINHLMDLGKSDSSLLTLKISGYSNYGNSILEVSNSIFSLLSQIQISQIERDKFLKQKEVLEFINNRLRNKGACYIATMAYGSYEHPQVIVLRNFRDTVLSKSKIGLWFISKYYYYSPKLVHKLQGKKKLNSIIRITLDQIIKLL